MDDITRQPLWSETLYEHEDTRELVSLVNDAADLVRAKGEAAFPELSKEGSRWWSGEQYIFVIDVDGNMRVHPDPALNGRNVLDLKDVNGKPIIRGLIEATTTFADKTEGWYHYQWPVPGGLLPRWKSSYVRLVSPPSGKRYVVGSGVYNDRMERAFVRDMVEDAVRQIETSGQAAFPLLRDPKGRFVAKDAYIFVIDSEGIGLVHPGFPNLEGTNLLGVRDTQGKFLVRDMLELVNAGAAGWVDYMWPKPGESISTQKSTYVSRANIGDRWVLVACGVYLADAPKEAPSPVKMSASELMGLVRSAAEVFENKGEGAYSEFREKGSKWFHDDIYFFVWTMTGKRVFHAANPAGEGKQMAGMTDIHGRQTGMMILDTASSASGEGWVHYMYPEPGNIFPTWKSTFVKRVVFPSGEKYAIGTGIYNMQMDMAFVEDIVKRAETLIASQGTKAFDQLRDKTGPFVFMDTYVFVDSTDGIELVNPGQPSLEGQRISDLRDVKGKAAAREYITAAVERGEAWIDYWWYKPGHNTLSRKQTYVRKVQSGAEVFIVGSGLYL